MHITHLLHTLDSGHLLRRACRFREPGVDPSPKSHCVLRFAMQRHKGEKRRRLVSTRLTTFADVLPLLSGLQARLLKNSLQTIYKIHTCQDEVAAPGHVTCRVGKKSRRPGTGNEVDALAGRLLTHETCTPRVHKTRATKNVRGLNVAERKAA